MLRLVELSFDGVQVDVFLWLPTSTPSLCPFDEPVSDVQNTTRCYLCFFNLIFKL